MFTYAGGVGARATKPGLSACSYPTGVAAVPVEVVDAMLVRASKLQPHLNASVMIDEADGFLGNRDAQAMGVTFMVLYAAVFAGVAGLHMLSLRRLAAHVGGAAG